MKVFIFIFFLILNVTSAEDFNPLRCMESERKFTNISVPKDFHIGNIDAKVTIIDYSSFSCQHCAEFFRDSLLNIKDKYVNTGKAVLIMRNFPLDEISLRGAMLLRCSEKSVDNKIDYFDTIDQLFDISITAKNKNDFDEKLYDLAKKKLNFTKQQVDKCLNDKDVCNEILSVKLFALKSPKINLTGTPTIFINGDKYTGYIRLADLEKIIENHLLHENE